MAESVRRRAKTRKGRSSERKKRREQQRDLQKQIDALLPDLTRQAFEKALQEEGTALLGREKGERRDLTDTTEVEASCNRCQSRYRAKHKLQNVRRAVQGAPEMTREERRERRQAVLRDAIEVYQGKDEAEIRRRLAEFRATWAEAEPKAVATLERDFAQTVAYLPAPECARKEGQEWRGECLRTTSPLERVQRQFRQKARQVVVAHSAKGAEANTELVICHRDLASAAKNAWPWAQRLEEALLAA